MPTHVLKTDPIAFDLVSQGKKTYEIRYKDRNYNEGDRLILMRTQYTGEEMRNGAPLVYTGAKLQCRVLHVLHGPIYGLQDKWCILSIKLEGKLKNIE